MCLVVPGMHTQNFTGEESGGANESCLLEVTLKVILHTLEGESEGITDGSLNLRHQVRLLRL